MSNGCVEIGGKLFFLVENLSSIYNFLIKEVVNNYPREFTPFIVPKRFHYIK